MNPKRCPSVTSFLELSELMLGPQVQPPSIEIRKLVSSEFKQPKKFYESVDYVQKLDPASFYYGAFHNEELVGIVRLAFENDVWVLRGMQVRAAYQFLGIGTRLIRRLEADIPSKDCFCLPYKWLDKFNGQIGFKTVPPEAVPEFLHKRRKEYQTSDLILMKSPVVT